MSAAENITPFKDPSPTFRVQSALKAEADVEVEVIDAVTADPEAGTLPNGSNAKSRALRRAFLAQSPAASAPKTPEELEMQELLVDATAFLGKEGGQIVASNVASFKKQVPHFSLTSEDATKAESPSDVGSEEPVLRPKSGNLFEYLMSLMMYQISVGRDQANITQMSRSFSEAAIKTIQEAGAKNSRAIDEYEASEKARSKTSFWLTFASIALTVVGAALCAFGAGAFVLAVGVSSLCMNTIRTSDGQTLSQGLDSSLKSAAIEIVGAFGNTTPPDWVVEIVKDVLMLVVVLVATAVLMGGISMMGQAVSSIGSGSAATAGTQVAANAGAQAAVQAGTQAAAQAGARAAVQAGTQAAAQTAVGSAVRTGITVAAEQTGKTVLQQYVGNAILLASSSPLVPSISKKIAQAAFPNDETAQIIMSACLQFTMGIAGTMAGGAMAGATAGRGLAAFASEEGSRKVISALKTFQTIMSMGSAGLQVQVGFIFKDQAKIFEQQGEARFALTLAKSIIDSLHTTFTSMQEAFKAAHQVFASINEAVENFLTPYSVQSMGYK